MKIFTKSTSSIIVGKNIKKQSENDLD